MSETLAELEELIATLSPVERAELDKMIAGELSKPWLPNPGPQMDAYYSRADLLLYGGAAGGGKTDLLVGLALTQHKRSVIFRRAYVDLRGVEDRLLAIVKSRQGYNGQTMVYKNPAFSVEFGALEKPGAEFTWQGRPHDLIGFDEGAQLTAEKVTFVMGWLRHENKEQRCRVVIASNPPMGGEGEWLLSWFAPWLDPLYANPAAPGELRWAYNRLGETVWVEGPGETQIEGETYEHMSRTFIPALLDDNPFLRETGYRARIQNMPEPMRSKLLKGDFIAGRRDDEWQVIPSDWVAKANERWSKAPAKRRQMIACAADVALGGDDYTAVAALHEDCWFAPIVRKKGETLREPSEIAMMILGVQRDNADISVDCTGGWGAGVRSHLREQHGIEDCGAIVFSAASNLRTRDGKLGFANLRAQMWWRFREALDPESGDEVMLPPEPRLTAELTAPRYKPRGVNILIEEKADIRKRLGASTDGADAVIMAWHRRHHVAKQGRALKLKSPDLKMIEGGLSQRNGWMMR